MRTRKSNKSKSFSFTAPVIGSSDDEQEDQDGADDVESMEVDDEDIDDQFEDEAVDDEGSSDDEADENDEDDESSNNSEESDGDSVTERRAPAGVRANRSRALVHGVPPYPNDQRQTRVYAGPLKKWKKHWQLLDTFYGPEQETIKIMTDMMRKWFEMQVLPMREHAGKGGIMERGTVDSPWVDENHEPKQHERTKAWYEKYRAFKPALQRSRNIPTKSISAFKPPSVDMICLLGPHNGQKQVRTAYSFGQTVSEAGTPLEVLGAESESTKPGGWLLDTGGIPVAMGWAPRTGLKKQFLAVCTVPYEDQDPQENVAEEDDADPDTKPEVKKQGSIQIWSIPHEKGNGGHPLPSRTSARLAYVLLFDWGRAKRMEWCPIPPPNDDSIGMLAVLCGDGQVRVVEVQKPMSSEVNYEWISSPVATLGFADEYMVVATCLSWVNTNRICLGHSDGSITLWSIFPQHMLMRHPVHISYILEIKSAYPSHPYHIATTPVGGCPTLIDLNLPSAERTYIPLPGVANFQPNLMSWNDHLQSFLGLHPSPSPHNGIIGLSHIRYFIQNKTLLTASSQPMCLGSGRTHPFVLVGCADGSLYAFNALRVLLRDRKDPLSKLKVFQHEYRPIKTVQGQEGAEAEEIRGAARILQGFVPEMNVHPRAEYIREINLQHAKVNKTSKSKKKNSDGKKKKKKKKVLAIEDLNLDGEVIDEELLEALKEDAKKMDMARAAVHEARTRITIVEWNPNVEFGWWAAASMGSGLVKVMDLGTD